MSAFGCVKNRKNPDYFSQDFFLFLHDYLPAMVKPSTSASALPSTVAPDG